MWKSTDQIKINTALSKLCHTDYEEKMVGLVR